MMRILVAASLLSIAQADAQNARSRDSRLQERGRPVDPCFGPSCGRSRCVAREGERLRDGCPEPEPEQAPQPRPQAPPAGRPPDQRQNRGCEPGSSPAGVPCVPLGRAVDERTWVRTLQGPGRRRAVADGLRGVIQPTPPEIRARHAAVFGTNDVTGAFYERLLRWNERLRGIPAAEGDVRTLPAGEVPDSWRSRTYVLFPGVSLRAERESFQSMNANLQANGMKARFVNGGPRHSEYAGSVPSIDAALSDAERDGRPTVVIAHSKGAVNVLDRMIERPDLFKNVERIVVMNAPYRGSVVADQAIKQGVWAKILEATSKNPNLGLIFWAGSAEHGVPLPPSGEALRQLGTQSREGRSGIGWPQNLEIMSVATRIDPKSPYIGEVSRYNAASVEDQTDGLVAQESQVLGHCSVELDGATHSDLALSQKNRRLTEYGRESITRYARNAVTPAAAFAFTIVDWMHAPSVPCRLRRR
ncbi:MAG: hypothetical protein HY078_15460 [Elusimicrobia bacterium]|nr:hypothetical protein [Elusimicrobiota bacterium]